MDIVLAATLLAILCIVGIVLVGYVLSIQIPLLRVRDTKLMIRIRYALFFISLFILSGLTVLLAIDLATVFFSLPRSARTINPIGVVVTFLGPVVMDAAIGAIAMVYWFIKRNNAAAAKLAAEAKQKKK